MKTTTLFSAYLQARAIVNTYGNNPRTGEPSRAKAVCIRQRDTFRAALLRRIEEGDRAREVLKLFADDNNWDFDSCGIINWDLGEVTDGQWQSFNPAQIAREALGR